MHFFPEGKLQKPPLYQKGPEEGGIRQRKAAEDPISHGARRNQGSLGTDGTFDCDAEV